MSELTAPVSHSTSPAVFLDKDGTLVENVSHNVDVRRVRIYPDALRALAKLAAAGYKLIVVSNQPGIAHGCFNETAIKTVRDFIHDAFAKKGIALAGFYFCPHHPEGSVKKYAIHCDCRKPRSGLIERAAKEHYIDTGHSWMVGDILNDVEAGNRAGCRTILVDRGNETEWLTGPFRQPDWVVSDLFGAAGHIVGAHHITNAEHMTMSMKS